MLFTAHVCKPRHGRGAVIFSAANQLDTSSERGVGDTGVACQDHVFFIFCHLQRMSVAGEWVGSVDSSEPVKHGPRERQQIKHPQRGNCTGTVK